MPRLALIVVLSLVSRLALAQSQYTPSSEDARQLIEQVGILKPLPLAAVPGAPFTATAVVEFEYFSGEDGSETSRTINLIARDAKGRTRRETRKLMPESFHGSPPLLNIRLYDPQSHVFVVCDPATHTARRQLITAVDEKDSLFDSTGQKEDLGTSTINGMTAKGQRVTHKTSRGWIFSEPTETTLEVWYSEEMHLNLLVRYSDSRLGVETVGISNLKRVEPAASLFEIPPGYKIVDKADAPSPSKPSANE